MEIFGPWSNAFKKSGGVITGNVIIMGTLQVQNDATFDYLGADEIGVSTQLTCLGDNYFLNVEISGDTVAKDAEFSGQVTIMYDQANQLDAGLIQKPKTAGVKSVTHIFRDFGDNNKLGHFFLPGFGIGFACDNTEQLMFPIDFSAGETPITIDGNSTHPNLKQGMMMHSVIFGM